MKKNAPSLKKESFHYYLYVAHTCVQPENAISPAVWSTNIFLAISLCVSPNSKPSVTADVQFCLSFSSQNTKLYVNERDHSGALIIGMTMPYLQQRYEKGKLK